MPTKRQEDNLSMHMTAVVNINKRGSKKIVLILSCVLLALSIIMLFVSCIRSFLVIYARPVIKGYAVFFTLHFNSSLVVPSSFFKQLEGGTSCHGPNDYSSQSSVKQHSYEKNMGKTALRTTSYFAMSSNNQISTNLQIWKSPSRLTYILDSDDQCVLAFFHSFSLVFKITTFKFE